MSLEFLPRLAGGQSKVCRFVPLCKKKKLRTETKNEKQKGTVKIAGSGYGKK
jgi:hypothetical protein